MEEEKIFLKNIFYQRPLWILFSVFCLLFLVKANAANAASVYFSPASAGENSGQLFSVAVYVSSPDISVNATQGIISFPADKLSVVSISKTGSIVNLWVQDPSFSNKDGLINFGGVIVNPGFQGSSGKILSVTFRALSAGSANLSFSSASVLANDGKGTNVLSSMGMTNISISNAPKGAVTTPETGGAATAAIPKPEISSSQPVDDGNWHNFNSINFKWNLPSGITGVNYDISNNTDYKLAETSKGTPSEADYDLTKNFADGKWYFFVAFEKEGSWGPTATISFQLDRTPPEQFKITREDNDPSDTQPVFDWQTTDKTSGIAYYLVKIGDGDWFDGETIKGIYYTLPLQSPTGSRILKVQAYDSAGNYQEEQISFAVLSKNSLGYYWYEIVSFVEKWIWLFILFVIFSILTFYFLIYRLWKWRMHLKEELQGFKNELRRDLKNLEKQIGVEVEKGEEIDLRPSKIQKARESLRKEAEHIKEDVKEEIKKLDDLGEQ